MNDERVEGEHRTDPAEKPWNWSDYSAFHFGDGKLAVPAAPGFGTDLAGVN